MAWLQQVFHRPSPVTLLPNLGLLHCSVMLGDSMLHQSVRTQERRQTQACGNQAK